MSESNNTISHEKPCSLCGTPRQVLVRCQVDESRKWHFVCPGKCWKSVSGGMEDAKGMENEFPYYRYGGMWKNKHADGPLNAKKPKKVKERQKRQEAERQEAIQQPNELASTGDEDTEPGNKEGVAVQID